MTKYYDTIEQGSDEWRALRCGILTASEVKKILTPKLKVANNEKTRQHVYEVAAQRMTEYVEPQYISDDMIRGQTDEIYALEMYSEHYAPVTECGFISDTVSGAIVGYSPDGLVGEDGLVEVKSRMQKYQMQTIADGAVPEEYMLQIQTGLLVSGRKWLDFISYCQRMPLFVKRVYPDPEYYEAIKDAVAGFENSVTAVIADAKENSKGLHMIQAREDETDII